MIKQFYTKDKKLELIISCDADLTAWGLPLAFTWFHSVCVSGSKSYWFTVRFLCFGFHTELWDWRQFERGSLKEQDNNSHTSDSNQGYDQNPDMF